MTCSMITPPSRRTTVSSIATLHYEILLGSPLKEYGPPSIHLMDAPSSLAAHSTLPPYEVRYTPSAITVKDQGVESTPPTRIANTCDSLISYFMRKTCMITLSGMILWDNCIKAPLNKLSLNQHYLKIWPHLRTVHKWLLLMISINSHILLNKIMVLSELNLLAL